MKTSIIVRTIKTAATSVAAVVTFTASASAAQFEAAFRTPAASYFMTAIGEVYSLRPNQPVKKAFVFNDGGYPHRWTKPPRSFVQWKSEWLVADYSKVLTRFDASGAFAGQITLPVQASALAVSGDALWIVNPLGTSPADQLWRSTDGKVFKPFNTAAKPAWKRFTTPIPNMLILGGGRNGELYVSAVVGPPIVHRIYPAPSRAEIPVAYSRSKQRATMEEAFGMIDDVTIYSLPVRDLLAEGGELAVLRNREDVKGPSGKPELALGLRVDRYAPTGRHVATAVFPRSAHWIVSVTPGAVTGINKAGQLVTAKWGKPIPGEVIGH